MTPGDKSHSCVRVNRHRVISRVVTSAVLPILDQKTANQWLVTARYPTSNGFASLSLQIRLKMGSRIPVARQANLESS